MTARRPVRSIAPIAPIVPVALTLALAAAGCSPSINPALKRSVDARLAGIEASGRTLGTPSGFEPMPLAAGQWTLHKVIDGDGNPGLMTYKVLSKEGGAWWVEIVNENYYGRSVAKMKLVMPSRTSTAGMAVKAFHMKNPDGQVMRFDESTPMMGLMSSMWDPMLASLKIQWQGASQEDATVPAGTFRGCYKTTATASFGPVSATTTSWSHTRVPISGLVKAVEVGGGHSQELLEYGTSGATSEF